MTLLWGIMSNEDFFFHQENSPENEELESYKTCKKFFLTHLDEEVSIDNETTQTFLVFFNDLLNIRKEDLIRRSFNHNIAIGKLEIRNFVRSKNLLVRIKRSKKKSQLHLERQLTAELNISNDPNGNYEPDNDQIGIDFPLDDKYLEIALWRASIHVVFNLLMLDWLIVPKSITETMPVYLPVSRTGFLLTYPQIASSSVRTVFSSDTKLQTWQGSLTLPYIKFLQLLIELSDSDSSTNDRYKNLINFINSEILHGTVTVKDDGKVIRYLASDMKEELPLSVTSSVVTELASLLLLLTTKIPLRLVIIEEPEAHLHPALQKKIAQLLIRFVHSGIPVWITTHSDTILHHFNNMIKLNALPEDDKDILIKEYSYTKDDLIDPSEVNLYQFERSTSHTTITKLSSGKYSLIIGISPTGQIICVTSSSQ